MKRSTAIVAAMLLAGGLAACSSGSSSDVAGAGGPKGCIEAQDASGTLSQLITGSKNGTETNSDIAKGFGSVASQMGTVSLIATGQLKKTATNAQVEAGRLRVATLDGDGHTARDVDALATDIKTINSLCPA